MKRELGAPIQFIPGYMERVWGGDRLRANAREATLPSGPIGEAWLLADHPHHTSVVKDGAWQGATLHALLEAAPEALLGRLPKPAKGQRFPLLLKILDATEVLSVQVHPDDEQAAMLGESDGGKTEMWHVLEADEGTELLCGFRDRLQQSAFEAVVKSGTIGEKLLSIPAQRGLSLYVPAGTVHALGAGLMVAEIQQNSDLTYRIYDWGRNDASGQARHLHVDQALTVADLNARGLTLPPAWQYPHMEATIHIEAHSQYFTAERIQLRGACARTLEGASFSILLLIAGNIAVANQHGTCKLEAHNAALLPASGGKFEMTGHGAVLHYYVADFERDVVAPLIEAGISRTVVDSTLQQLLD